MAYIYTETTNFLQIAERQYASASEIRFTIFTSCIGIVSVNLYKNEVVGIHLPLRDANNAITATDITLALCKLTQKAYKKSNTIIIGEIDVWRRSYLAVYENLLHNLDNPEEYPFASGVYGAKFSKGAGTSGDIEITY